MKNKFVTRGVTGALALAMVCTTALANPALASASITRDVIVSNQKQLNKGLRDERVKTITIKTNKVVTLKIGDLVLDNKTLIVNAPKSKIDSKADFKKIMIKDGASFIDRGTDNLITVSDKNSLKLVAGKQAEGMKVTINSKGGDITVVGNGDIASVNVKGKSDVTVRGKSDSAPKIVNNAEGASISTAMKASVILNKAADLIVKAGAKITSLTVKAVSDITVADGAAVDTVNVSADKVNLKVDGTVAKVAVNAKADVAISGSTKNTIEVTNNAAGSNVQTSVRTDLKLNADAKISLDKGAEGSSVKAEKEGVKPSVENKTSADVTIKDSTGTDSTIASGKTDADAKPSSENKSDESSSSGGSSGSGSGSGGSTTPSTPSTPGVTKPVLNLESDVTDRSYLKANDTLTAKVTGVGAAQVTYRWKKNGALISGATSANYMIKSEDEGSRITVTVVVTAGDGQRYSLTSEETDYIWEAVHVRFKNSITVEYGTTAANLKELLNDKYNEVSLGTAADSEIVSGTVVWDVTDEYHGDVAGDYTATGTATVPEYYYFAEEAAAKVTCKVTVKKKGALKVIGKKVDADVSGDSTCEANQKIFDVSMKGETIVISGYYAKAARDASNQVGFVLELSADGATDLRWSKDGETESGLMEEKDFVYVQLDLKEYLDTPKAIYVKDGESGVYTPVYIQVEPKILEIYVAVQKPYETTLEARTFPNVGTVGDLNLPTEVIFCADQDEKDFPIVITWACDKVYGKEGAGTYTFYPILGKKPAYTQVYLYGLDPIHIELKMGK